ncbi:MAG: HEAT repeat domain-containing protein [Polyangiaceae bacterium]
MTYLDFDALAERGAISDIPDLLPFLPYPPHPDWFPAVFAVGAILYRSAPEDIAWLDRRRWPVSSWTTERASLRDQLMRAELQPPDISPLDTFYVVAALTTMHPDGHLRERAVRLLDTRTDGREVPYLLLRVNDWVPQVRTVALLALHQRITQEYTQYFIDSLPLVVALRWRSSRPPRPAGRQDRGPLQLLSGGRRRPALPRAALRRAAAQLLARTPNTSLLLDAATSGDPLVAAAGTRILIATFPPEALRDALPRLLRGPSTVRWLALKALCDTHPSDAAPHVQSAVLDPATSVRELARYRWKDVPLPPIDFPAFYRAAIPQAKGPALATAVRALAEVGTASDTPTFEPFLQHPSSLVRAAAVHGIGRCGQRPAADLLVASMNDPSSRVAQEARRWVRLWLGRAAVTHNKGRIQ